MKKYLELFKDGFDATVAEKTEVKNWPYVGYSPSEGVVFTVIPAESQSGYQMVDLGLSVKWADRNVGAATPQDNGLYFSWGNVDGHAVDESGNVADGYSFDVDTYDTTTLGSQYTGSTLDAEHDAATVNMGGNWRMPTVDEINELVRNTDRYYIGEDGNIVDNSELSSSKELRSICLVKTGEDFNYNNRSNFIEIPFAGGCSGTSVKYNQNHDSIWSSSIDESWAAAAQLLGFNQFGELGRDSGVRSMGRSVRGVHP